jgi:hypothetical protein
MIRDDGLKQDNSVKPFLAARDGAGSRPNGTFRGCTGGSAMVESDELRAPETVVEANKRHGTSHGEATQSGSKRVRRMFGRHVPAKLPTCCGIR